MKQVGERHIASAPAFHSGVGRLKRLPGVRSMGHFLSAPRRSLQRKLSRKISAEPAMATGAASLGADEEATQLSGAVAEQGAVKVADAAGESAASSETALRAYYGSRTQHGNSDPHSSHA